MRLLLLGGTTEASRLAARLAGHPSIETTLSLAGRTTTPAPAPIPCRVGGFGGVEGLVSWLGAERIDAVVDATHPFAARITAHAAEACGRAGIPLARFTRPAWTEQAGDRWSVVSDLDAAAAALGLVPRRVFLTTGRLGLAAFKAAAQHDYLLRTIDPPAAQDCPPHTRLITARGPFAGEDEAALMHRERIDVLVTKNSGGHAGKIEAARALNLPVIMVARPATPSGRCFEALGDVERWIAAHAPLP